MQLILEQSTGRLVDSLSFTERLISIDPTTGDYEIYRGNGLPRHAGTATRNGFILTTNQGDTVDTQTEVWTKSSITAPYMRISSALTKQGGNFVDAAGTFSLSESDLKYHDGAGNELTATDLGDRYSILFGRLGKVIVEGVTTGLIFRDEYDISSGYQASWVDDNIIADAQNADQRLFTLDTRDGSWQILSPLGNVRHSSAMVGVATFSGGIWTTPMGDQLNQTAMQFIPYAFGPLAFLFRTTAGLVIDQWGNASSTNNASFSINVKTGTYGVGNGRSSQHLASSFTDGTFTIFGGYVHIDSASAATFTESAPPPPPPPGPPFPQERDENIASGLIHVDVNGDLYEGSKLTKVIATGGLSATTSAANPGVLTIDGSAITPNFNDAALTGDTTAQKLDVSGELTASILSSSSIDVETATIVNLTVSGSTSVDSINATGEVSADQVTALNATLVDVSASGTAALANVSASGTLSAVGQASLSDLDVSGQLTIDKKNLRPVYGVYEDQGSVPADEIFAGNAFFINPPAQ